MRRPFSIRLASLAAAGLLAEVPVSCRQPAGVEPPGQPLDGRAPFVRVLGSVQDGGFPHAACHHDACRAARESGHHRFVTSLAVVLPRSGKTYLFDATPDLADQLELLADVRQPPPDRVDRAPVDGVFLTHAHIGHYLGLALFGFEAIHTHGLPVFCTPRMARFLRSNGPWSQLVELENIRLEEIGLGEPRSLGEGVSVSAIRSPHRDELSDTVGFLIRGPHKRLLYLPDTDSWDAWSVPLLEVLSGVDIALIDGTFYSADELPGRDVSSIGHPLIEETIRRFSGNPRLDAKRIYFTHLNHSNPALDPESAASERIREAGFGIVGEGDEFDL